MLDVVADKETRKVENQFEFEKKVRGENFLFANKRGVLVIVVGHSSSFQGLAVCKMEFRIVLVERSLTRKLAKLKTT